MNESIILTGPMGSGKSSVGKILASRLGYRFMDLDALIVEKTGKSINQIFDDEGEDKFRELESLVLSSLSGQQRIILSTGGGAVLREENREQLHALGLVVNLSATVDELTSRLSKADDRPLLKGDEPLSARIKRILNERERFYADADIRIDTTGKKLEDVARKIDKLYLQKQQGVS